MLHHSAIDSDLTDIYLNENLRDYIFKWEGGVMCHPVAVVESFPLIPNAPVSRHEKGEERSGSRDPGGIRVMHTVYLEYTM